MGDTTSTTIAALLPSLVGPAVEAFEQESNLRGSVTVYPMMNGTLTIPKLGTITAVAVGEGEPPGPGATHTPGSATLTSVKYRVVRDLTDQAVNRAMRAGNFDLIEREGRICGRALNVKLDKLITALFSGFSQGSGSGSGTTMAYSLFGLGFAQLQGDAAPAPYTLVMHPLQMHYLMQDLKYTAPAKGRSDAEDADPYFMGYLGGVKLQATPNTIAIASSATHGAMISKEAIALGVESEIHMELERIQDTGYKLTASMEVAVVEVMDKGGYYYNVKAG